MLGIVNRWNIGVKYRDMTTQGQFGRVLQKFTCKHVVDSFIPVFCLSHRIRVVCHKRKRIMRLSEIR